MFHQELFSGGIWCSSYWEEWVRPCCQKLLSQFCQVSCAAAVNRFAAMEILICLVMEFGCLWIVNFAAIWEVLLLWNVLLWGAMQFCGFYDAKGMVWW
ncbi:hypothetical protein U1Q18_047867 [Sarracenia purpurea var. burkii]